MKAFIVSAPQSASGKTTVSLGLMAAFSRRGMRVAPFKAGPDFIDPGYHRMITGVPSVNLDGWMTPPHFLRSTFLKHSSVADISVIEGVMGLFDGMAHSSTEGSTAQVATITGAPVVLVVNARGMAASVVPLVSGFANHDPAVKVAGVVFNNVGGERHARILQQAIFERCSDVCFLGAIPRDEALALPSRHLGLVTAEDNPLDADFVERLADTMERHLDMELLTRIAEIPDNAHLSPVTPEQGSFYPPVTIAVARDPAFCFIYEDNLRLLKEAGAELAFFSPLADSSLPDGTAGIYLPGGYPELHQEQLASNSSLLDSIRGAVAGGMPVYAECGGLLYLTEGIVAEGGDSPRNRLAGVFPVNAIMGQKRAALGYREVELACDTILGIRGERLKGHEFHYSTLERDMPPAVERVYRVARPGEKWVAEGYATARCLASYVHLHFGSFPDQGRFFVETCRGKS